MSRTVNKYDLNNGNGFPKKINVELEIPIKL